MHFASGRWLQVYRYTTIGIQSFILVLFLVRSFTPPNIQLHDFIHVLQPVSIIVASLALIHIVVGLVFYRPIAINNELVSPGVLAGLFVLTTLLLMHNSGGLGTFWAIPWLISVGLSGILGIMAVASSSFLITLYYLLMQSNVMENGMTGQFYLHMPSVAVVIATYGISFASWAYWRKHYTDQEAAKIDKLSGQLKNRKHISDILIQSIDDGIVVIDTKGKITIANPAAAKMTEWESDDMIDISAKQVLELREEGEKNLKATIDIFSNILNGEKSDEKTLELTGKNGTKRIVSISLSAMQTPDNNEIVGAIAVMRDISEAHAEEKRRADFISTASHEMRTPVAAIEGYLALALNEKVSKIDSNARSYLMKAHSSSQHLGKLFQDLLTSAKAEDGRLVSHPQPVELGKFIEQLTEDLRFAAEKKGLLVERLIGANEGASNGSTNVKNIKPLYYVMADPDRLREVITNLFDNAVKYTESGKITIGLTGNNDVVQLFIQDTGVGIPEEDIPHMFQKFYRVDNSATRTIGGTGLGLFICRKIIELYKGTIWVESKAGEGSTFYINLPRISAQQAAQAEKAA